MFLGKGDKLTCKPAFALCDFCVFEVESFAPVAFPPMLLPLPPAMVCDVNGQLKKTDSETRREFCGMWSMNKLADASGC